jgi:hypothetical protein
MRYLDEFVSGLACAPLLLEMKMFPDAKEITESMGMFDACRRFLALDTDSIAKKVHTPTTNKVPDGIVVVGDGATPRTASLFAFRTKQWQCYSIDPIARPDGPWKDIQRLKVAKDKIENVRIKLKRAIVILMHAHVDLHVAIRSIEASEIVAVVACPCCNWHNRQAQLFGKAADDVFTDPAIMSVHNTVHVWSYPLIPADGYQSIDELFVRRARQKPKPTLKRAPARRPVAPIHLALATAGGAQVCSSSGSSIGGGRAGVAGAGAGGAVTFEELSAAGGGSLVPVVFGFGGPASSESRKTTELREINEESAPSKILVLSPGLDSGSAFVSKLRNCYPCDTHTEGDVDSPQNGHSGAAVRVAVAAGLPLAADSTIGDLIDSRNSRNSSNSSSGGSSGGSGGSGGGGFGSFDFFDSIIDVGLLTGILKLQKKSRSKECTS